MMAERAPQIVGSVAEVAAAIRLARGRDIQGRVVFLIGAGCSVSAKIPGAAAIARRMVRDTCDVFGLSGADDAALYSALVTKGRLTPCLKGDPKARATDESIDWYRVYDEMFRKNYVTPDQVRDLLETVVEEADGAINWAHLCLGELVKHRFVTTVLTTNFDQLVLSGMARAGILPVVCDGIESLNRIVGAPRHPQLVELHGSRYTYLLRNRPEEVEALRHDPQATAAIQSLFQHATTFVAIGYGGREDGVMDLLVQAARAYPDKNLFWVNHSAQPAEIGEKVLDFLRTSRNGGLLVGQDADRFFLDLCRELGIGPPSAVARPLDAAQRTIDDLARSTVDDADIAGEISAARGRVSRLAMLDMEAGHGDPLDAVVSRIREARLAGDAATAYRLANEALRR